MVRWQTNGQRLWRGLMIYELMYIVVGFGVIERRYPRFHRHYIHVGRRGAQYDAPRTIITGVWQTKLTLLCNGV